MAKEVKDAKVVEETTETKKEEKVEETKEVKKETKKEKKNDIAITIIKRCWDTIFWCAVACLLLVWILDFVNVKQNKDPKFCIKKETLTVENGTVDSCLGMGYKVFTYHTSNMDGAKEFGPFWSEPRK